MIRALYRSLAALRQTATEHEMVIGRHPPLRAPLRRATLEVIHHHGGQLVRRVPLACLEAGIPVLKLRPEHAFSACLHLSPPRGRLSPQCRRLGG